jgi:ribulose-5-phosphate 4-epimerase/fuculose-1-phosphate aldolase
MANVTALRNSIEPDEREARIDLAACYRLIAHFGMDDLIFTHIAARVPGYPDQFLINPFGLLFHEITASSLLKVDMAGNVLEPSPYPTNTAGIVIHSAILSGRPDVQCSLHTHTQAGVAVSCLEEGLLPLNQWSLRFLDRVAFHDYEGIALDTSECARLQQHLGDKDALILRNHGLLTVGRSIAEAFGLMFRLEQACQTQMSVLACGRAIHPVTREVQEHTRQQFSKPGITGGREWPALLRLLDAKDPGYRN